MKKEIVVVITVSAILFACGQEEKKSSSKGPHFPEGASIDGGIEGILDSATVYCANSSDCPNNVGLVVMSSINSQGARAAGQCSGTLIGEDTVLTNSHCIPDEIKANPSLCSARLGFVIPNAIRDGLTRSLCKELIYASPIDEKDKKPDYAFFKLQRPLTSKGQPISRAGFSDMTYYHAYTSNPVEKGKISGEIVHKQCLAVQNTMLIREFTHNLAPLINFFECRVIGGNSGSALLDGQLNVVGVVSHGDLKRGFSTAEGKIDKIGLGANLACVDIPGAPAINSADCSKSFINDANRQSGPSSEEILVSGLTKIVEVSKEVKLALRIRKSNGKIRSFIEQTFSGRKPLIQFDIESEISCVKPRSMWRPEFISKNKDPKSEVLHVNIPKGTLEVYLSIDRYFRQKYSTQFTDDGSVQVDLDIRNIDTKKPVAVLSDPQTSRIFANTKSIYAKWCSQDQLSTTFDMAK